MDKIDIKKIIPYVYTHIIVAALFISALCIVYLRYLSNQFPLWLLVLVFSLNILWNFFLPKFYCKSLIKNEELSKKAYLWYVALMGFLILICLLCVYIALGNIPFYVGALFVLLMISLMSFSPLYFNNEQNDKKQIKKRILNLLYLYIFIGLIFLLGYICVNGYPLLVINLVLLLNILYLVFMILFDPTKETSKESKKDRKKLLFWSLLSGILLVVIVLITPEMPIPSSLKFILFFIGFTMSILSIANRKF